MKSYEAPTFDYRGLETRFLQQYHLRQPEIGGIITKSNTSSGYLYPMRFDFVPKRRKQLYGDFIGYWWLIPTSKYIGAYFLYLKLLTSWYSGMYWDVAWWQVIKHLVLIESISRYICSLGLIYGSSTFEYKKRVHLIFS